MTPGSLGFRLKGFQSCSCLRLRGSAFSRIDDQAALAFPLVRGGRPTQMMLFSELNTRPDFTPVNASSFLLPSNASLGAKVDRYFLPCTTLSFATFQTA